MIFTMIFYVISYIFFIVSACLPEWQVWPDILLNAINYLSLCVVRLNFIFPITDPVGGWITAFLFLINFEVGYVSAKIIIKIVNYVRGVGKGLDI